MFLVMQQHILFKMDISKIQTINLGKKLLYCQPPLLRVKEVVKLHNVLHPLT